MRKHLLVATILLLTLFPLVSAGVWFDSDWNYRTQVDISANGLERNNWPVEYSVDFTGELNDVGSSEAFDINSVRVIEYDDFGNVLYEVSSGLEETDGFNVGSRAEGNVIFILNGTTSSSETRHFFIYFDTVLDPKVETAYPSTLVYNFNGDDFNFGNDLVSLNIGTDLGEGVSGIYYARRVDSGTLIFDVSKSSRPVEYLEYKDGVQGYSFDLKNDATLIYDSAVKQTVVQEGSEVLWDTNTETNLSMIKSYTIYEGSPWVKIRQVYSNNGPVDITRRSNGISALALDTQRAFGMDNLIGPSIDPFSWKSTTKISPSLGIGVVNLNEVGTSNYFSQGSIPMGKIGIQLNPTVIPAGGSIENEALIYFNDENNHNPLQDLNYQFTNPVDEIKMQSEKYDISVTTSTEFKNYNLNEMVVVTATVIKDSHNMINTINATLNLGTVDQADDVTIILYDDGAHLDGLANDNVYSGSYIIDSNDVIGEWSVISYVYDIQEKIVSISQNKFDVKSSFNSKLFIENPSGLVNRDVLSVFQVLNFRNDTPSSNAIVTCSYNGTNIDNIMNLFNGNYSINFTTLAVLGSYELICVANKDNNIGSDSEWFYLEPAMTQMNLGLSVQSINITTISQSLSEGFEVITILSNVGVGSSYAVNISPSSIHSELLFNSSIETCDFIETLDYCSKSFEIVVKDKTIPGIYDVTMNLTWMNLDKTINSTIEIISIDVKENPVMALGQSEFNAIVGHGQNISVANLSIESIGNYNLENIDFNCLEGGICDNFTLVYFPVNYSNINPGVNLNVEVFVDVPLGYLAGNYSGILNVAPNNFPSMNFTVNVEVPKSSSWNMNRNNCSLTVLIDSVGNICRYSLSNTGNLELNYTVAPLNYNYVIFNETNFSVPRYTIKSFYVEYDTNGAVQGQFNSNYIMTAVSEIDTTTENFDIFLDVVFGPSMTEFVQNEAEQLSFMEIKTSIIDRSGATIDFVKADVTMPNNIIETIDFINLDSNEAFGVSTWVANFTNTNQRGEYEVLIYSKDMAGGIGNVIGYSDVYAILNTTIDSGWKDYLLGETGSIYYSIEDGSGNTFVSDVNISLYDSINRKRLYESYKTNAGGILLITPSFSIPDDAPIGIYNLSSSSFYLDEIVNKLVNTSSFSTFNVHNPLFVELDTNVIWYPNGVMTFYVLAYSKGVMGTLPTAIDLVVYDPAQSIYLNVTISDFNVIQKSKDSVLYVYKYAMPPATPVGNFLATVTVSEGDRGFHDVESFMVSSGGPFDLILTINNTEVSRKEEVEFDILMKNMGEVSQDVFLDFWISDLSGSNYSKVTGEAIYVPAHGNTTITRRLYIFPNQPLEIHTVTVRMDYSTILDPIVTTGTFVVQNEKSGNETNPIKPDAGGGGGAGTESIKKLIEKEKIIIIDIDPDELDIGRGDTGYIMIEVKNNMNKPIDHISFNFEMEGLKNLTEFKGALRMEPRELVIFPIKVEIPKNFPSGFYTGNFKMNFDSEVINRQYNINVFDSKDELINHRIISLNSKFEILRVAVSQAKKDGLMVDNLDEKIDEILNDFDLVKVSFSSRKYFSTLELLSGIENKIEEVDYDLDSMRPGIRFIDAGYLVIILAIFILIVLILILRKMISKFKNRQGYRILKRKYLPKKSIHIRLPRWKPKLKLKKLKIKKIKKLKKRDIVLKSEIKDHIKTLEEQFRYGYISEKAYLSMKEGLLKDLSQAQ